MADTRIQIILEAIDKANATLSKVSRDVSQLETTGKKATGAMRESGAAVGVLRSLVTPLAGAIAGAFSVAALVAFTKAALDAADALKKFGDEVGIGVEELSKLQYAASQAGIGEGPFQQGLQTLSRRIADAGDASSQAAALFRTLGIAVTDASGEIRPTSDILQDVADRFAGWEDGANKARIAQELFGTRNARFINLLNQGSAAIQAQGEELEKLGGVVTEEAAVAGDNFGASLTRMQVIARGLAQDLGVALVPAITEMLTSLQPLVVEVANFSRVVGSSLRPLFQAMITLSLRVVNGFRQIGVVIGAVGAAVAEASSGNFAGAKAILSDLGDEIVRIDNETQAAIERVRNGAAEAQAIAAANPAKTQAPSLTAESEKVVKLELARIDTVRTEAERDYQLTILETQRLLNEGSITQSQAFDRNQAAAGELRDRLVEVNKELDELAKKNPDVPEIRQRAADARVTSARANVDATAPRFEGPQNWSQGMDEFVDGLGNNSSRIRQTFGAINQSISSVSHSILGLINGTTTWGQVFANVGTIIINTLIEMGVQMLVQAALRSAMNAGAKAEAISTNAAIAASAAPAAAAEGAATFGANAVGVALVVAAIIAGIAAMSGAFYTGGYTGNAGRHQVAGVVHGQEFVMDAASTARIGPENLYKLMTGQLTFPQVAALATSAGVPGYASGGYVRPVAPAPMTGGPVNVQMATIHTRQQMRDFMLREGVHIVTDEQRRRSNRTRV